jgi:hypothetical protein
MVSSSEDEELRDQEDELTKSSRKSAAQMAVEPSLSLSTSRYVHSRSRPSEASFWLMHDLQTRSLVGRLKRNESKTGSAHVGQARQSAAGAHMRLHVRQMQTITSSSVLGLCRKTSTRSAMACN